MNKKFFKISLCILMSTLMIISLNFNVFSALASSTPSKTQKIVDMANRTVIVPTKITKVYSTSPTGTILLYTLNPNKLVGINYKFTLKELEYIPKKYQKLPVLGGWFGKNGTGNIEAILKAKPDIILSMGDIDKTHISSTDRLQKQLNIPIIMIDGNLQKSDKAYEFLGKILHEEKTAKVLANYSRNLLNETKKISAKIPNNKKLSVYYAEGPKGLETEGHGSIRLASLYAVGGLNAADIAAKSGNGKSAVSLEDVIVWNPSVILVGSDPSGSQQVKKKILNDSMWSDINAVKEKRVYNIPHGPFNWFDRPDSVNRLIGIKWLGNLLYPNYYKYDIRKETRNFYKMFYHINLTDTQLNKLLN